MDDGEVATIVRHKYNTVFENHSKSLISIHFALILIRFIIRFGTKIQVHKYWKKIVKNPNETITLIFKHCLHPYF